MQKQFLNILEYLESKVLSKQVKIFHDYYEQIQKFIPKKNIYCDDMYSNRYNFFISKDDYSNEIQYQLDTILADMCTSHYDPKTDMSLYSILIVPQKIIDNRQSLIAEDFFNQKKQDYIASNTVIFEVVTPDENGFKNNENLEMPLNPIVPSEPVELGVEYAYAA